MGVAQGLDLMKARCETACSSSTSQGPPLTKQLDGLDRMGDRASPSTSGRDRRNQQCRRSTTTIVAIIRLNPSFSEWTKPMWGALGEHDVPVHGSPTQQGYLLSAA